MTDPIDLSGRVCIVAGGASGLGEAAAHELADRGATVIVNDLGAGLDGTEADEAPARAVATAIREAGGEATAHFGDVADLDYAESVVADAVDAHGRLDAVVDFAGILRDGYLTNLTEDDWDAVLRVHLKGHFSLLRAAARHWREAADGGPLDPSRSFVAVTSRSALGNVGQANYSAAKAGVLGLVRTASTELHATGVRVNALMPTAFTRMTEAIPAEHRPYTREEMPPEKVAPAVAFLASEAAAAVTGVTFYAGGDRIGIYDDPAPVRQAIRPGGWSAEAIAESIEDVAEGIELTRTGTLV